jgi:heavy metal sensor kinase
MRSLRGRFAVWYAVALAATMFVFATVIYVVQRSGNFAELDARARLESDLIATILGESYLARGAIIGKDPFTGRPGLVPDVAAPLEAVPDYVVVLGGGDTVMHMSSDARALPYGSGLLLIQRAAQAQPSEGFGMVNVGPPAGEIRYYVRSVNTAGPRVTRILSGAPTAAFVLGPRRLLTLVTLIAPLILVASTLIGYLLVGRTLKPVNLIVDEVEAMRDGRSLHRRLVAVPTNDEIGRLTTTLNAMIARMERSFATLRTFTADASHELKTPLTVLRAGIEGAITHPKTPPEVLEVLEETLIETKRMSEMVDSLLMLARADEGRAPLHLETVDLRELLEEVAETANILSEQSGVQVSVDVPAPGLVAPVDRMRVRQLLMNLLTNAIKYTPAGGTVTINSARADGGIVITVQDSGIGIAAGDLPHVFDRFWRADAARSRTGHRPGAGLGLAISKWIAEAHGGSISVQSRPSRGTTFTVTLPTSA